MKKHVYTLIYLITILYMIFYGSFIGEVEAKEYGIYEGDIALPFVLKDDQGNELDLKSLRGKKVILNFFASWCPPCQEEMPLLVDFQKKLDSNNEVFIGVNMTSQEKNKNDVKLFMKQYRANFTVVYDEDGKVMEEYRIFGIPTTIVIDEQGRIEKRINGVLTPEMVNKLKNKD